MALFTPLTAGALKLRNRVVMAPMTRARAAEDHTPLPIMADHFGARAGAGLIITDATNISTDAVGWAKSPGIFAPGHVKAWQAVTQRVHDNGGLIVCQLWHTGRQSHSSLPTRNGKQPVSASDVALSGKHPSGADYEAPQPLPLEEIPNLIQDYVKAAKNAIEAGFDAVEVHSANGYLLDQFLQLSSNKRTDEYGCQSIENRTRLMKEVLSAVVSAVGPERTGIRFSPNGTYGEMASSDFKELFDTAITIAAKAKLAYIHVMDGLGFGAHEFVKDAPYTLQRARSVVEAAQDGKRVTALFGNVGYDGKHAEDAVGADNGPDAIAFGRPFLNNPDLPKKLQSGEELAPLLDMKLWYHGGEQGYTELPGKVA